MSYHYLFPSVMRMKVELSNPISVYSPGDDVAGTVVLECDRVLQAKIITVTLEGMAFNSFIFADVSTRGGASGATIQYIKDRQAVWLYQDPTEFLSKGIHRLPFLFHLPSNLPPSFEAMSGAIRYQFRVEVDGQLIPNKLPFTVNPQLDLNQTPEAAVPIVIDVVKEMKSALKKKGEVILKGEIPRSGFVPGEEILVNLHVNNKSTEKLVKTELKLMQKVLLRGAIDITSMPSTTSANMIQHLSDESQEIRKVAKTAEMVQIAKNSSTQLKLSLRIPAVAQSFNSCPIIKLEHYLKIKLKTGSKLLPSIKTDVPIIIGTVPLRGTVEEVTTDLIDLSAPPAYSEVAQAASTSGRTVTYKESVFGKHATTKETLYTEPFAPKYPFYSFPSTESSSSSN